MSKQLNKITQGQVRDREVTWFSQAGGLTYNPHLLNTPKVMLIPGKSIKIHLYWAMKNCEGCPQTLRDFMVNIPNQYQARLLTIVSVSNTICSLLETIAVFQPLCITHQGRHH